MMHSSLTMACITSDFRHGSKNASANGTGGAAMFGGNASGRRGRSGSCSAVHNGPFTVDVAFELNNHELLITDDAFDKIAD
jgi:hypothetical protein